MGVACFFAPSSLSASDGSCPSPDQSGEKGSLMPEDLPAMLAEALAEAAARILLRDGCVSVAPASDLAAGVAEGPEGVPPEDAALP